MHTYELILSVFDRFLKSNLKFD